MNSSDDRQARAARRLEARRQKILDAALRLWVQKGMAGFSVAGVAAAADLAPSAIYHYFQSVEELRDRLAQGLFEAEVQSMWAAISGAPSGAEGLVALLSARIAHFRGRMDDFRLLYEVLPQSGAAPQLLQEVVYPASARINDHLEALLRADQAAGRLPVGVQPRALANLPWCLAQGILSVAAGLERCGGELRHAVPVLEAEAIGLLRRGAGG